MPDSLREIGSVEDRLHQFLIDTFPSSDTRVSSATGAPYPLLLLRVQHDLAGFAVANGDPRRCFDKSYAYFKTLYADQHRDWDDLNLVFILCLGHRDPDLETFCAGIENDAFFCRKFTVALDAPWERELARLPFFPLERRRHRSLRPPSAQGLLKACGVPAALAAAVVGRVGEETILQGCLTGRFGTPRALDTEIPEPEATFEDSAANIRMKVMEIENFRAYRRPVTFDLDADLVLLFGPNGFGKTSFFDAVDFAATGDIGRLGLTTKEDRFRKAARHLDAASERSSVTLTLGSGKGDHRIQRTVDQRRQPQVDASVDTQNRP